MGGRGGVGAGVGWGGVVWCGGWGDLIPKAVQPSRHQMISWLLRLKLVERYYQWKPESRNPEHMNDPCQPYITVRKLHYCVYFHTSVFIL